MASPVTVKLKDPIPFGSETITELTLREPLAKDFRRMPLNPNTGDLLDFAGQLAAQPKAVIDQLRRRDMQAVLEVVGGFFDDGPATGPTS